MVFFATRGLLGPSGTMLSDIEEGELVKLNENGSPVEFYVAKHDYEPDLNGAGRTLLVRKDCYDSRAWDSGNVNAYANCSRSGGSRPIFTLPSTIRADDTGLIV